MRIPRRDEGAVNLNPVPGNRLSSPSPIEAFGGQFAQDVATVGKALGKVGDAALDAYEKERDRHEVALVTSKLAETDRKIDARYKDRVSKIGEYISDSPQHAEILTDALVTDSESAYNEAANSITDPRIRKRFEDEALRSRELRKSKAAEIESKGWDSYRIGKQTEAVDTSAAAAVESYKDPEAFDIHADRVRKGAANIDSINGVVEEDPNSATKKVMSSLYERAVSAAIDANDAKSAEALLAKGRDAGWVSKERGKLDDAVDSVKWFGEASLLTRQYGTESAALAALNKQSMPEKERDEKAKVIKQQFAENERLLVQSQREGNRAANEYYRATGQLPPKSMRDLMSQSGRDALENKAKRDARGDRSVDRALEADLMGRLAIAAANGEEWDEDLSQYVDVLGSAYGPLVKRQAMHNNNIAEGSVSFEKRIAIKTEGMPKDRRAEYENALFSEILKTESGGKVMSLQEKEKLADWMLMQAVVVDPRGWVPNETKYIFQLSSKQRDSAFTVGEKTDVVRPVIPKDFRDRNKGIDEDTLEMRYRDFILGNSL